MTKAIVGSISQVKAQGKFLWLTAVAFHNKDYQASLLLNYGMQLKFMKGRDACFKPQDLTICTQGHPRFPCGKLPGSIVRVSGPLCIPLPLFLIPSLVSCCSLHFVDPSSPLADSAAWRDATHAQSTSAWAPLFLIPLKIVVAYEPSALKRCFSAMLPSKCHTASKFRTSGWQLAVRNWHIKYSLVYFGTLIGEMPYIVNRFKFELNLNLFTFQVVRRKLCLRLPMWSLVNNITSTCRTCKQTLTLTGT